MATNIHFNSRAVRASDCVSDGLNLVQTNYWLYFGISLLAMVLTACIPCLNYFLVGPVSVGVYYTLIRQMRNEPVEFGMMFNGFQKFVPAMVIGLIQSLPQMAGDGMRLVGNFGDVFREINRGQRGGDTYNYLAQSSPGFPEFALGGGMIAIIAVIVVVTLLFFIAWSITFYFTIPLLAEYDLSIGDAIVLGAKAGWANWTGIFVLSIFQGLIALGGALLLCIGVFFVLPIIYGSHAVAYRQVFPDNQERFNNEPPRPDAYGGNYGMPQQNF